MVAAVLIEALDNAHWELSEALQGMPDEDLWRRADPRLLSVGELVAHMAYGEAVAILGSVENPLVTGAADYYLRNVDAPFALPLGSEAIRAEHQRVHEACKTWFLAESPDLSAQNPHRPDWTWSYTLQYMAFHVAYHTGQIYSVRHLLGHETVDN